MINFKCNLSDRLQSNLTDLFLKRDGEDQVHNLKSILNAKGKFRVTYSVFDLRKMILYRNNETQREEEEKLIRYIGEKLLQERRVVRKNETELNLSKSNVKIFPAQCYF